MRHGRATLAWVAVALAATFAMADRAHAEIGFTAPQVLDSTDAGAPQVAVDPQGRATVVWLDLIPEAEAAKVQAQRLDPAGSPGPVQTLAVVSTKNPPLCVCPKVTVDGAGRATVVWQGVTSEGRQIEAARIGTNGVAQPSEVLSPSGVEGWYGIPLAGPNGEVLVVWETAGLEARVESVLVDAAGVPGDVHPLSPAGEGRLAVPAVSPAGRFHVAWTGSDGIKTTGLDSEGAPEEVLTVSPPGEAAGAADIGVDSQDRVTIVWWRGSGEYEAKAVRLAADGTPGPVWTLSAPGQDVFPPKVSVDPEGRATAVWQSFDDEVFAARIDVGGTPGPVRRLSPEGHVAADPQVGAAPEGRAVVAWTHPSFAFVPEEGCLDLEWEAADDVVRIAFLGADGQLERIYEASPHEQQSLAADLALDPSGLPWVAWESYDGTYFCEDWDTRVQVSHALTLPPLEETTPPTPLSTAGGTAPLSPATLVLAKKGRVRNGRIVVRARCQGTAGTFCSGKLRLKANPAYLRPGIAARARQKQPLLTLARGRYWILSGQAKTLTIPVPPATRDLLSAAGPDWIPVTARSRELQPSPLLIRLPGGDA